MDWNGDSSSFSEGHVYVASGIRGDGKMQRHYKPNQYSKCFVLNASPKTILSYRMYTDCQTCHYYDETMAHSLFLYGSEQAECHQSQSGQRKGSE
jgi:hypothetical protein